MNKFSRFLLLKGTERWLLMKVGVLLMTIQLGLPLLPFKTLYGALAGKRPTEDRPVTESLERQPIIIEAIELASRHSPIHITCLAKALAGRYLLARSGVVAELRIGVRRNVPGGLEAHAWLEDHGQIILGEIENMAHYTLLPPLELRENERNCGCDSI